MIRKSFQLAAVLALAAALAPASASAATTCTHSVPGLLEVNMSAHKDAARLDTGQGVIKVFGPNGFVGCSGNPAFLTAVDTVLVTDESDDPATATPSDGSTQLAIHDPATFAPGKTAEPGQLSEVEFLVDPAAGSDAFVLGGTERQQLSVGTDGAAWTPDADAEMSGMPFDNLFLFGGDADDYFSLQGGNGTGAALSTAAVVRVDAGRGADNVAGSNVPSGDLILAGEGSDSSIAYGGDDTVRPGPGDDTVQGGSGNDTVDLKNSPNPVTLDLADVQRQNTGEGADSFAQFENAVGSIYADRLSGDAAANLLDGFNGDDVLEGRGGADELNGGQGSDTVSYAGSQAAVNVDLARTIQATDGDKLFSIDHLTGSPFGDTLAGNAVENRIDAGAGTDSVAAGDGADRVEVRDGEADRVSCGGGADTAISDRRSVDALDADCDSVDALPEPPGAPATPGTADTTLRFSLSAAARQRVLRQRGLRLRVRSPFEGSTAVTSASASLRVARSSRRTTRLRLRPVTTRLAGGSARTLTLSFTRRQLAALRRAFAAGQRPVITVTARATDAAGNRVTRRLRIRAKR